jgi:hypothetical protein
VNLVTFFAADEPVCPATLGRQILVAYIWFAGANDGELLALADSAMAAHGVNAAALSGEAIAYAVRTERRGLSLLRSLDLLREAAG